MAKFEGFEVEEKDIPKFLLAGLIGRLIGVAIFVLIYFVVLKNIAF